MPARLVEPAMIRTGRAFLSMGQDELAAGAGLSPRTVVTLEQGKASLPSRLAAVAYLKTRGISFTYDRETKTVCVGHDLTRQHPGSIEAPRVPAANRTPT